MSIVINKAMQSVKHSFAKVDITWGRSALYFTHFLQEI